MYSIGSISSRNTDTDQNHKQFYVLSVFFLNVVSIAFIHICPLYAKQMYAHIQYFIYNNV